jgi:hypothetical protein
VRSWSEVIGKSRTSRARDVQGLELRLKSMASMARQVRDGPMTAAGIEALGRLFTKALIERALGAELSHHLGYPPGAPKPEAATNHRNGMSGKTVLTEDGPVPIAVPRDRHGTFEPQLIGKHARRVPGLDDQIITLYARGLPVREIQAFLQTRYGVEVSPDLISPVTDAVMAEVTAWQTRPLERLYPVVFFDALRVKIRDEAVVRNKAVLSRTRRVTRWDAGHARPLDRAAGKRELLAEGLHGSERRGCADILIAVTDGLKGMPEALGPAIRRRRCRPVSSICAPQPELRELEGPSATRARAAGDLHHAECRGGPRGAGGLRRRAVGRAVPDGGSRVATRGCAAPDFTIFQRAVLPRSLHSLDVPRPGGPGPPDLLRPYFPHIHRRMSGSSEPPCASVCAPSPHSCLTS